MNTSLGGSTQFRWLSNKSSIRVFIQLISGNEFEWFGWRSARNKSSLDKNFYTRDGGE